MTSHSFIWVLIERRKNKKKYIAWTPWKQTKIVFFLNWKKILTFYFISKFDITRCEYNLCSETILPWCWHYQQLRYDRFWGFRLMVLAWRNELSFDIFLDASFSHKHNDTQADNYTHTNKIYKRTHKKSHNHTNTHTKKAHTHTLPLQSTNCWDMTGFADSGGGGWPLQEGLNCFCQLVDWFTHQFTYRALKTRSCFGLHTWIVHAWDRYLIDIVSSPGFASHGLFW